MASPWKLLAGLVSRRRQQKQERGSTDDVKPDVSSIAELTEAPADNRLSAVDRAANEKPFIHEEREAVSVDPHHAEEAVSIVDDTADVESARPVEAADPALSNEADTAAHAEPKVFRVGEGQTRKRMRGKKPETIAVVVPPAPTAFGDAINLDEEIRLLRYQLARKLQMQNAQLKRMLERFER
ncbi:MULTISPECIES: hypothetical protein [Rhizobium]|uniref:hypothetical protein n=1 Tax=Rhizobium TaxID=379 RepID=UPI0010400D00|nr:hypothetical protein [Rhizobium leguminosarum]MBY3044240.1 hypothetical protein [Rhizobium leguminosarum]TBY46659.1 hypothetical protein E0H54_16290 [Rhizobium leguminosarum bv. viciae]UWM80865.1 hypothetical protein N2A41_19605 [Rhizobium leguminosarum bv. viciae]